MIVSEFMYKPWEYALSHATKGTFLEDGDLCTPSITAPVAEKLESCLIEYLKNQVCMRGLRSNKAECSFVACGWT